MLWLSVDPGETVGWALWDDMKLVDAGQTPRVEFIDLVAAATMVGFKPFQEPGRGPFNGVKRLVIEEWKLYPWKAKDLGWDEMRTSRAIGALEFIARQGALQIKFQPAVIKEFAIAGGAKELFRKPVYDNRHMNDAIMHGWFYIFTEILGNKVQLPKASVVMVDPDVARSVNA